MNQGMTITIQRAESGITRMANPSPGFARGNQKHGEINRRGEDAKEKDRKDGRTRSGKSEHRRGEDVDAERGQRK